MARADVVVQNLAPGAASHLGLDPQQLRAARPDVRFNLEMITRDPLKIPCLTQGYWVTFAEFPARNLARALAMVRAHAAKRSLPRVAQLSQAEKLMRVTKPSPILDPQAGPLIAVKLNLLTRKTL